MAQKVPGCRESTLPMPIVIDPQTVNKNSIWRVTNLCQNSFAALLRRPVALVRGPDGGRGSCFQKHSEA